MTILLYSYSGVESKIHFTNNPLFRQYTGLLLLEIWG
jgi:hypothetical protein